MRGARKEAGFTLVEVLIAMFIFALISAGSMTAMMGAINGKAQIKERMDALGQIQMARSLMRADLSQIMLRDMRDLQGGTEPYLLKGGTDTLLTFLRHGRTNPGGLEARSEFQRVSYLFENGRLIRRSLSQTNPAPQTKYVDRVLLTGLANASMRFQVSAQSQVFLDGENIDLVRSYQQDFLYVTKNDAAQVLPKIVSLTATFENGQTLVQHFEVRL